MRTLSFYRTVPTPEHVRWREAEFEARIWIRCNVFIGNIEYIMEYSRVYYPWYYSIVWSPSTWHGKCIDLDSARTSKHRQTSPWGYSFLNQVIYNSWPNHACPSSNPPLLFSNKIKIYQTSVIALSGIHRECGEVLGFYWLFIMAGPLEI
jgi:hypothetical protein